MGNVYMEADQVRFKDSTYRNVQEGLAAALEGGGGGGTTVVANPEGSATADLAKLQVGTTIYGIPSEAADISYDNTSSGLTADDVQEAIDELNTGLSGVTELIPSGATSSNKLATANDIPDAVTGNPSGSATAGNLTKLQIGSDIYNVPSGGSLPSTPFFTCDAIKENFIIRDDNKGYSCSTWSSSLTEAQIAELNASNMLLICFYSKLRGEALRLMASLMAPPSKLNLIASYINIISDDKYQFVIDSTRWLPYAIISDNVYTDLSTGETGCRFEVYKLS